MRIRRYPLQYDPLYWGAVFPLGMYAASADEMIEAIDLRFLAFLPPVFFWLGLAAWAATALGLALDLLRRLRRLSRDDALKAARCGARTDAASRAGPTDGPRRTA